MASPNPPNPDELASFAAQEPYKTTLTRPDGTSEDGPDIVVVDNAQVVLDGKNSAKFRL